MLLAALIAGLGWWQAHAPRSAGVAAVDQLLLECLSPSLRLAGDLRNRLLPDPPAATGLLTATGLARLRALEDENSRLRALLALRDARPAGAVAAEVIGRSRVPWQGYVIVDKGTADGVGERMVALTPDGVLGQVASATPHTATVLPLTDRASGIGGYWATQILPFQDAVSYPGFVEFETAVYHHR